MSILTTVIVTWNTRDLLRRCLETLVAGTRTAQTVWVVDNASTDGTADLLRQAFPDVRLLVSERNLGFAAANNRALRAAPPGRYVLLLNPDTEVPTGAVDALADFLDQHPEAGAAGVQLLNPDGSPQRSFDHFYSFLASFWRNLLVAQALGRRRGTVGSPAGEAVRVDWIVGACLMLRTAALREVGLLDERFFMYGEEIDLQWRLRRKGWEIVLLPRVHVVHHGGQSSRQAHLAMMIQEYRSRYLLISEHTSRLTSSLYVLKAVVALAFWSAYWGGRRLVGREAGARARCAAYVTVLREHLNPCFYAPPAAGWPAVGAGPGGA